MICTPLSFNVSFTTTPQAKQTPNDSTTGSSPPSSVSSTNHKSNVGVIAGVIGTVGVLACVVGVCWFIRRSRKVNIRARDLDQDALPRPLPPPLPLLEPFPISESITPSRTTEKSTDKTGMTTPFRLPAQPLDPRDENVYKPHQPFTALDNISCQDQEGSQPRLGDDTAFNKTEFSAMRAELRAVKERLAVLEGAEEEPPDYVSSYTGRSL
ncbi:hypothetical protein PM082_023367 [Marasmius tenuissimus]|nr:hypothetical protein PM082_023367 [Marasmius tenuissimus]